MEQFANELMTHLPYVGVIGLLLISGFGLPLPEDIPLLVGGYLCAQGYANIWVMVPLSFAAVLGADCILYWLGRRYGHHVPKLPLLRRYLNEAHLTRAEASFHNHGGKTLFIARFLPGLRAAVFFTAGVFKIPFWKMLAFDGSAAVISVPALVLVTYFFADHIDQIKHWSGEAQLLLAVGMVAVIGGVVAFNVLRRRKVASAG